MKEGGEEGKKKKKKEGVEATLEDPPLLGILCEKKKRKRKGGRVGLVNPPSQISFMAVARSRGGEGKNPRSINSSTLSLEGGGKKKAAQTALRVEKDKKKDSPGFLSASKRKGTKKKELTLTLPPGTSPPAPGENEKKGGCDGPSFFLRSSRGEEGGKGKSRISIPYT